MVEPLHWHSVQVEVTQQFGTAFYRQFIGIIENIFKQNTPHFFSLTFLSLTLTIIAKPKLRYQNRKHPKMLRSNRFFSQTFEELSDIDSRHLGTL